MLLETMLESSSKERHRTVCHGKCKRPDRQVYGKIDRQSTLAKKTKVLAHGEIHTETMQENTQAPL